MKMYFPKGGLANYYSIGGGGESLKGIFVVKSNDVETKKLENGKWRSLSAIEIKIDSKL